MEPGQALEGLTTIPRPCALSVVRSPRASNRQRRRSDLGPREWVFRLFDGRHSRRHHGYEDRVRCRLVPGRMRMAARSADRQAASPDTCSAGSPEQVLFRRAAAPVVVERVFMAWAAVGELSRDDDVVTALTSTRTVARTSRCRPSCPPAIERMARRLPLTLPSASTRRQRVAQPTDPLNRVSIDGCRGLFSG